MYNLMRRYNEEKGNYPATILFIHDDQCNYVFGEDADILSKIFFWMPLCAIGDTSYLMVHDRYWEQVVYLMAKMGLRYEVI